MYGKECVASCLTFIDIIKTNALQRKPLLMCHSAKHKQITRLAVPLDTQLQGFFDFHELLSAMWRCDCTGSGVKDGVHAPPQTICHLCYTVYQIIADQE